MKNLFVLTFLLLSVQIFGQNAFVSAIESKNYSVVQKLTLSGTDVNQPLLVDGQKMTALSLASLRGDVEMVNLLIKKGALVAPVLEMNDALMFAAKGGNLEIVELLISKGANVMNESKSGHTARDFALAAGHKGISDLIQSEMQTIVNRAKSKKNKK